MKCFEGENTKDCGCLNPLHTLPWLQPWARALTGEGGRPTTQPAARHLLRKTGTECGRSGMPGSGWPFVLPCQVREVS